MGIARMPSHVIAADNLISLEPSLRVSLRLLSSVRPRLERRPAAFIFDRARRCSFSFIFPNQTSNHKTADRPAVYCFLLFSCWRVESPSSSENPRVTNARVWLLAYGDPSNAFSISFRLDAVICHCTRSMECHSCE